MLALMAEFLRAAATAAEDGSNPEESQLAVAIDPLPEEARLTCWGISRYTIYSMLAPLAPVQNIGGTVGGPSQLPPTPQQPPVQPAPQQPPARPAPQQPPACRHPPRSSSPLPQPDDLLDQRSPSPHRPATPTTPTQPPHEANQQPLAFDLHAGYTTHAPNYNHPATQYAQIDEARLVQIVSSTVANTFQQSMAAQPPLASNTATLETAIAARSGNIQGIDLTNIQTWSGLTDCNPPTPFWPAFMSATSDSTKTHILQSFLMEEQEQNIHVQFTIRPDLIRDLKVVQFQPTGDSDFIAKGVTPFAIHKLTSVQAEDQNNFEAAVAQATHITIEDIVKRNKKLTRPITDPTFFLELIATYRALLHILIGERAPLYLDIDEIYTLARTAYTDDLFPAIKIQQLDWFAHVIWAITHAANKYFKQTLRLDQLERGICLPRPLTHIMPMLYSYSTFTQPKTPAEIRAPLPTVDGRKRPGIPTNNNDDTILKRQRANPDNTRKATIPSKIYQIHQQVQNVIPRAPLSHVLKEGGSNIPALISATGIPTNTCC